MTLVNVIIPMAGEGSRFSKDSFVLPKPLISVDGKPMIQWVLENLTADGIDFKFYCIVRTGHEFHHNLSQQLQMIDPRIEVIYTNELTEGPACTCLLAKNMINNSNPLLIANSDQFVEWDSGEFYKQVLCKEDDGCVLCFKVSPDLNDTKWSYAKTERGYISEIQEKVVISENATVGIYFWRRGSDFVDSAEEMIHQNVRVNNEFYVAPTYNYGIKRGKMYTVAFCKNMWGLGVPDDLAQFEANYLNKPRCTALQMTYFYVNVFNDKNIDSMKRLMSPSIILKDQDGTFQGIKAVMKHLEFLFTKGLKIEIKSIMGGSRQTMLHFTATGSEGNTFDGVDLFDWSKDPIIITLDAYVKFPQAI